MNNPGAYIIILLALAAVTPLGAAEADGDWQTDKWRAYVGAFWPSLDSRIGINAEGLPPLPPIRVEDALGVGENKLTAWGGLRWQVAKRHSVEFEYFSLNRNGGVSDTFDPPIRIADVVIEAGSIDTSYETSIGRVTYGYSVVSRQRSRLKLKAGLHVASLSATLGYSGAICSPATTPTQPPGCPTGRNGVAGEDVTAPLPHFGFSYTFLLTPKIAVGAQAIGFALQVDDIDGSILEMGADIVWQPWRHVGLGAGVRYFDAKVESTGSFLNGTFDFDYLGPAAFLQGTF
jgi:hypothetical protein